MKYAALIIDVRNSKKMDVVKRQKSQIQLSKYTSLLNDVFDKHLLKSVVFSGGDEIQGLFYRVEYALMYFLFLRIVVKLDLRCGIGVGEITVFLENENSPAQDGPAYYLAREAIMLSDKKNMDILINTQTDNDLFVNEYLSLLKTLENDLKAKQFLVYQLMDLLYPIDFMYQNIQKEAYLTLINEYFAELTTEKQIDKESIIKAHITYYREIKQIESLLVNDKKRYRGLNAYLATLLNTSRQNIEQIIKAGKILEINSLKTVLYKMLIRFF